MEVTCLTDSIFIVQSGCVYLVANMLNLLVVTAANADNCLKPADLFSFQVLSFSTITTFLKESAWSRLWRETRRPWLLNSNSGRVTWRRLDDWTNVKQKNMFYCSLNWLFAFLPLAGLWLLPGRKVFYDDRRGCFSNCCYSLQIWVRSNIPLFLFFFPVDIS